MGSPGYLVFGLSLVAFGIFELVLMKWLGRNALEMLKQLGLETLAGRPGRWESVAILMAAGLFFFGFIVIVASL